MKALAVIAFAISAWCVVKDEAGWFIGTFIAGILLWDGGMPNGRGGHSNGEHNPFGPSE